MTRNFYHNRHVGFTLVETLIAITIFVTVILGPITIAANGMQSAYYANEQATAIFLAQEGLESIKRLRDNNALDVYNNGSGDTWEWYDALPAACKTANGCDLDIPTSGSINQINFKSCAGSNSCRLKKNINANTSGGDNLQVMYGYGSGGNWQDSPYTRTIKLTPQTVGGVANAAVEVTVTVSWSSPIFDNTTREVVLQSWLYDQYERYEP